MKIEKFLKGEKYKKIIDEDLNVNKTEYKSEFIKIIDKEYNKTIKDLNINLDKLSNCEYWEVLHKNNLLKNKKDKIFELLGVTAYGQSAIGNYLQNQMSENFITFFIVIEELEKQRTSMQIIICGPMNICEAHRDENVINKLYAMCIIDLEKDI